MSVFTPIISKIKIEEGVHAGKIVSSTLNLPAPRNLAGWFTIDTISRLIVAFVVPKSGESSMLAVKSRVTKDFSGDAANLVLTTGQGIFGFETPQNPRSASGYFMLVLERIIDQATTPTLSGVTFAGQSVALASAASDLEDSISELHAEGSEPRKSVDAPMSMRRLATVRNTSLPRQHFRFIFPVDISPLYDPAGFSSAFLEQQAFAADVVAAKEGLAVEKFAGFSSASKARETGRKRSSQTATATFDSKPVTKL